MRTLRTPHLLSPLAVMAVWAISGTTTVAQADVPCLELDECRVLIEINASDGDIGFHVLHDAEGWQEARIVDPSGEKIFQQKAYASARDQKLTENFFESNEPVCEPGLREEEDEPVVTLPEFFDRFPAGTYEFRAKLEQGGEIAGTTQLTHTIPAAPTGVDFDGSTISWAYGSDLGECTTWPVGFSPAPEAAIVAYEIAMEPDDDTLASFVFSVTVPSGVNAVSVPTEYLSSLPADTPLKVEVGAIERRPNGSFGNQTFTEADGFCSNPDQAACPDGEAD